nr:conserved virulence factor C family protein [Halalkalibacillus halophilus]
MRIISIEPTPSPYSMKINIDESLADGVTESFQATDDLTDTPTYAQKLLQIEGVKELYRVIDFIALERNPKVEWELILPKVKEVMDTAEEVDPTSEKQPAEVEDGYGEIHVFIQMFRQIPMQVKLEQNENEQRFGLANRFTEAAMEASKDGANMLEERKWTEQDVRYGEMEEVGQVVVDEIEATYNDTRLSTLVKLAQSGEKAGQQSGKVQEKLTFEKLELDNWKERYAALDRMPDPTLDDLEILGKALEDEKMSIRRLATAYLGMIESPQTLPYLYKALEDRTVTVRRTAGDCLSDLGYKEAIPNMIDTLDDKSRIVRWRAAMFLYEYGDETALPALEKALEDPEFEVRMQAKMALARIKEGQEAQGSIWKQMTEMTNKKNQEE